MSQHILVVDDEQHIRDLLTIWLVDDPRCKRVTQAHDIEEALRLAESLHPDVIVLDFRVGPRTSIEILPQLRRSCPNARILIHTASRDEALLANVEGHGADRVIEKASTSLDELVEAVLD